MRIPEKIFFSAEPFPIDGPCGPFLETLLSICYEQPSYLRFGDIAHHISLIDALMQFKSSLGTVMDIPLAKLGLVVREWVMSFFDESYHSLMPVFALDTARFVLAHEGGKALLNGASVTQIPAMVAVDSPIQCLDAPDFKRAFNRKSSGRGLVLATVPNRCALINKDRRGWFAPDRKFLFQITRYFLSPYRQECVHLEVIETDAPKYDISNAPLRGNLWLDEEDLPISNPSRTDTGTKCVLHVPLRWITHAVIETKHKYTHVPVPEWH